MNEKMSGRVACYVSTAAIGAAVLGSYGYLSTQKHLDSYWAGLKGPVFKYWAVSALITATSFLFLIVNWCFLLNGNTTTIYGKTLNDSFTPLILPILLVFLLSAATWAWITIAARKGNKLASKAVTLCLWLTALSSFGLFILAVGTREEGSAVGWKVPLATVAGMFVASHHIIWDAELWRATWPY